MNIPDKIILTFKDNRNHHIPNLIFDIIIPSKRKNDYIIGPFKTDESGWCEITKKEIKDSIEKSMEMFIMDYSQKFEECSNIVSIKIDSYNKYKERIKYIQKFYGKSDYYIKLKGWLKKSYNKYIAKDIIIKDVVLSDKVEITVNFKSVEY